MSMKHFKNGQVKVGGTALTYANTFSIDVNMPIAEATPFGATETTKAVGIMSWGGNIGAYHDQDAKVLYTAAAAGASTLVALYPDSTDATTYWAGYVYLSTFKTQGAADAYGTESSDFVGTGALSTSGFS